MRNIRAMFEAKVEETSPPSRGRSPALSEAARSSSSRPISKIRNSFVAVERSGEMGPILGLRKVSDGPEFQTADGAGDSLGTSLGARSISRSNSNSAIEPARSLNKVKEEEAPSKADTNNTQLANGQANGRAWGTSAKTKSSNTKILEPEKTTDLGVMLKGSPFEPLPGQEPKTAPASKPTPKKPVETVKSSQIKPAAKTTTASTSTKPKAATKPVANKPTAISTSVANGSKVGPGPQSARSTKSAKSLKTPTTPKEKSLPHRPAASKPSLPAAAKQVVQAPIKEPTKAPAKNTSRLSLAAHNDNSLKSKPSAPGAGTSTGKAATPSASKAQSASPATSSKKIGAPIPQSGFVKPPLKSPTRPVQLPASLTTHTTASAGKLGSSGVVRSGSRTSTVGTKPETSAVKPTTSRQSLGGLRTKPSRQSLAPSTHQNERPSSRASTKPSDEGFLARMMRPTASSSSKTHDKVEVPKTPPKKSTAPRPSRRSNIADPDKHDKADEAISEEEAADRTAREHVHPTESSKFPAPATIAKPSEQIRESVKPDRSQKVKEGAKPTEVEEPQKPAEIDEQDKQPAKVEKMAERPIEIEAVNKVEEPAKAAEPEQIEKASSVEKVQAKEAAEAEAPVDHKPQELDSVNPAVETSSGVAESASSNVEEITPVELPGKDIKLERKTPAAEASSTKDEKDGDASTKSADDTEVD